MACDPRTRACIFQRLSEDWLDPRMRQQTLRPVKEFEITYVQES